MAFSGVQAALYRLSSVEDESVRLEAYMDLLREIHASSEEEFREELIRLAFVNEELRSVLLPMLKT